MECDSGIQRHTIIPDANDQRDDIRRMCEWIAQELGDEVPLHFSAFHPDFRMRNTPPTPAATLIEAREIAIAASLKYVYTGNVLDVERQSTYCPGCSKLLIERSWYDLGEFHVKDGCCAVCGTAIAGHFENTPGNWGTHRLAVDPAALLRQLEAKKP
jgi:pyruvate formate lyase activating enzyme